MLLILDGTSGYIINIIIISFQGVMQTAISRYTNDLM